MLIAPLGHCGMGCSWRAREKDGRLELRKRCPRLRIGLGGANFLKTVIVLSTRATKRIVPWSCAVIRATFLVDVFGLIWATSRHGWSTCFALGGLPLRSGGRDQEAAMRRPVLQSCDHEFSLLALSENVHVYRNLYVTVPALKREACL